MGRFYSYYVEFLACLDSSKWVEISTPRSEMALWIANEESVGVTSFGLMWFPIRDDSGWYRRHYNLRFIGERKRDTPGTTIDFLDKNPDVRRLLLRLKMGRPKEKYFLLGFDETGKLVEKKKK